MYQVQSRDLRDIEGMFDSENGWATISIFTDRQEAINDYAEALASKDGAEWRLVEVLAQGEAY